MFIKDKIRLLENKDRKKITLIWISSHKGIAGNEEADQAAKQAIVSGRDSQIGIPLRDLRNLGKDIMYDNLFTLCEETGKKRHRIFQ